MSRYFFVFTLLLFTLSPAFGQTDSDVEDLDKPIVAIKTNLLYDVATLINFELEVPIQECYSVAAEWVFPWWRWGNGLLSSRQHTLQMLHGTLEVRRWLYAKPQSPVLTGFYASIYAGGGLYDFEYDAKGYQGEFILGAGIGCGFAHTINRSGSLRMEYALGIGYLKTKYRYYKSYNTIDTQWHAIEIRNGHYSWFGLTRAKVSIAWLLSRKNMKGGVR